MPTYTIFAATTDDYIDSSAGVYATAVAGGGTVAPQQSVDGLHLSVANTQSGGTYYIDESFLFFDTSAITTGEIPTSVTFSLNTYNNPGTTIAFTCEARAYTPSSPPNAADWRTPTQLTAATLLATLASTSFAATNSYAAFTENGTNFQAAINKGGTTSFVVAANTTRTSSSPGIAGGADDLEYINWYSADNTGTTLDPKIVIVTASLPAPSVLGTSATIPTPTVSTSGGPVTVHPTALGSTATMGTPSITGTPTMIAFPAVLATAATLPTPTIVTVPNPPLNLFAVVVDDDVVLTWNSQGAPTGTPLNVTVTSNNQSATIAFTPVSADQSGGLPIDLYRVTPYINGVPQVALATSGATTPIAFLGLSGNTTYTVTVAAHNADGYGPESPSSAPFVVGGAVATPVILGTTATVKSATASGSASTITARPTVLATAATLPIPVVGIAGNSYDQAVTNLGSLAMWLLLNETSGAALDSSGHSRTGTYSATGVTRNVTDTVAQAGVESKGVSLATQGSITVAHDPVLNLSTLPTDAWMIAMDVQIPGTDGVTYPALVTKGDGAAIASTNGYVIFANPGGALGFKINGVQYAIPGVTLTTQAFIAISWDGTTLTFWLNGSSVQTFTGVSAQSITDTGPLTVGGNGAVTIAKLTLAKAANTSAIPGVYNALHGSVSGGHTVPAVPTVPAAEIAGWGGVKVLAADDFNMPAGAGASSLSSLFGWGLPGDVFQDGWAKAAEDPINGVYTAQSYARSAITFDGNSNLVITAAYVPAGVPTFAGPQKFYSSGAIHTSPPTLTGRQGLGAQSNSPATGFAYYPAQTELIIQIAVSNPGLVNGSIQDQYEWIGGWLVTNGWATGSVLEIDWSESSTSSQKTRVTVHDSNTAEYPGSGYDHYDIAAGDQPPPGQRHIWGVHTFTNASCKVFLDGRQVGESDGALGGPIRGATITPDQPLWLNWQYGMTGNAPRSFYSGWTTDKALLDYVVIYAPAGVSSAAYIGGGIAPGTVVV